MVDVPVYYHEEARVTNGVLVRPGVNWDASRNVLSVPFKRAERSEASGPAAPTSGGITVDAYLRDKAHEASAGGLHPAGAPAAIPVRTAVTTAPSQPAATPGPAQQAITPRALPMNFTMRKSDQTIQRMLERWGSESGWKIVWESGPVVPILGDANIEHGEFLQAADFVVKQAQAAGYRIQATAYSNQVLRIGGRE